MHRIRTTIHPNTTITVSDEEYLDLQRMGLIVEDDAPKERKADNK